ncbi:MAG: hypothetical protein KBS59_02110 [Clostridiales bacterium]|nr:hypothetical protein [Clostridiales bacterium]
MRKIKMAPLCDGAVNVAKITLPLVILQIVYILLFIKNMTPCELLQNADLLFAMTEDVCASLVCSLGGTLFFDFIFKHETGNDRE